MPTLAAPLDCAKLETRNERIHQLSTPPSSPVTGQVYYNTTDNTFYWWDGTIWQSAKGGAPGGSAGGDLTGTYPNPQIAAGTIVHGDVNAANIDGAAGTPSMRTLGTGAQQAAAGNAAPNAHRTTHEPGGGDAMTVDAAVGTGSLRTLGAGAQQAMPGNRTLDVITAPAADLNLNSKKITALATPISGTDAANKAYVDAAAQNLDVKASCRAASPTLTNINLASPGATIDGVTMAANDRVLVKEQSTNSQNGIYVWNGAAVPMTRAIDADDNVKVSPGMFTFIEQGTTNADSGWILTTDAPITIGTTGLVFTQFSGAGAVVAGGGLTKTGNTLDVVGTSNRLQVLADSIDIDPNYVGQASITTVSSTAGITTGKWNASLIDIAHGGTNAAAATAARLNLGVPTWYTSATHGAGTTISIPQTTHKCLASRAIIVQCQVEATGAVILPDVAVAATGDVTITFGASQSANTIRVCIIGLQSGGAPDQPI